MTTEFNLSEARKRVWRYLEENLVEKVGWGICKRIMQQIQDQDKEFIRLLKEIQFDEMSNHDIKRKIDKLAGSELIK